VPLDQSVIAFVVVIFGGLIILGVLASIGRWVTELDWGEVIKFIGYAIVGAVTLAVLFAAFIFFTSATR